MKGFRSKLRRLGWKFWVAAPIVLLIVVAASLYGLLYTQWFQNRIRQEVITRIETVTGAKAFIRDLYLRPTALRLRLEGLSVRKDDLSEPFLEVPAADLDFSLVSFFTAEISLETLDLDSPHLRIITAADGSTNLPSFPEQSTAGDGLPEELFEMAVDRVSLVRGRLQWNDQTIPLSFGGGRFRLETRYQAILRRYVANVRLGESHLNLRDKQPLLSEGEAELHIYPDRIVVPKVHWASTRTTVTGDIEVTSLNQPQATFRYEVDVQLKEWASWFGLAPLAGGSARVRGEGRFKSATEELAYSGNLAITDLLPLTDQLALQPVSATVTYKGDAQTLNVRDVAAEALGGTLAGEARVENLSSAAPRYWLAFALEGFPLEPLTAAIAQLPPAVRNTPWASALSGTIEAEGRSLNDLEAKADIDFTPPVAPQPNRLPLAGAVELDYTGTTQTLTINNLDLAMNDSRFQMSGSLREAGRANLKVQADLDGLDHLTYWLRLADADDFLDTLSLSGSARLGGQVTGTLAANNVRFQGNFDVRKFTIHEEPWERLRGALDISPGRIRVQKARLDHAQGGADINITANLADGPTAIVSSVNGEVSAKNLRVASLLRSAALDQPLTGVVNADVSFNGPPANLQGAAHIELVESTAWDWRLDRVVADATLTDGDIVIKSFHAERQHAKVDGSGQVDQATGDFRFAVEGADWNVRDLETFNDDPHPPSGVLAFDLKGQGRLPSGADLFDDLSVSGSFGLAEIKLGVQDVGAISGKLTTSGRRVDLSWEGDILSGSVTGHAEFRPDKSGPYNGECTVKDVDLVLLARLADFRLQQATGTFDSKFKFSGEATDSAAFVAEGEVTRFQLTHSQIPGAARGYEVWNPFPMRWKVENDTLDIDGVHLIGEGTNVVVDGIIALQGDLDQAGNSMDVAVEGEFNLAALESFRPGLTARGQSELDVRIRGTAAKPSVRGRMQIRNATLRHTSFANGLSKLNGRIRFNEGMVRIEELRAESGGGTLALDGTVVRENDRWDYRLQADIDSIRVRYPESLSSVINGRLTYSGTDLRSLLSGEVVVNRVTIGSDLSLGNVIASLAEPTQTPASNQVLVNMGLSVRIASVPNLLIETALIRNVQASMDLQLSGTAVSPSLLGDLNFTQGELLFQGSRYTINRSDINFYNPFRVEPVVNIELETRIRDVDIALIISGPASFPNLSYRSDPPLRTDQLLDLIALARSPTTDPVLATQQTPQQQSMIQSGLNAVLSRTLTGSSVVSASPNRGSQRLQRFFGVSRLKVDPQAGGAEFNPGARISTEQQITPNLTLLYSYDLSEAQQQIVRFEWAPTRQWSFIITRDENGLVGADLLFKKRLR